MGRHGRHLGCQLRQSHGESSNKVAGRLTIPSFVAFGAVAVLTVLTFASLLLAKVRKRQWTSGGRPAWPEG